LNDAEVEDILKERGALARGVVYVVG